MMDLLAKYQEINKNLVLEKVKQTLNGDKKEKINKIEDTLNKFEVENNGTLKNYYIYKLRHTKKDYHYWLLMLHFYRWIDLNFEAEVIKLFHDNKEQLKLLARDIKFSVDLFFKGEEALKIKQMLEQDMEFKTSFNEPDHYDTIISIKKDILKKLLINNESGLDLSNYIDIIYPEADFSRILLKKEMKDKIYCFIKEYNGLKKMIDSGQFKKEIRGIVPVILFRGFPGTGKTLTAHAMANELGLPLVKIKNIERHFHDELNFKEVIESLNNKKCVILLDDFDLILKRNTVEADELFEGFEISQNMILLTSNEMNLENEYLPLLRRITYKFTFKIPGRKFRKLLWEFHIPEGYKFEDDINLEELSTFFILTGGNIKNIMLNYVMLHRKDTVIEKKKLVQLIKEEIEKNDYCINYHINIKTGYDIDPSKIHIKNINKFNKLISKTDKLVRIKQERVLIGIYSEYNLSEFSRILSYYLKQPVIAEMAYNIEKRPFKRYDDREEMKDYLYELLENSEHFFLFGFSSVFKDCLDDIYLVKAMLALKVDRLVEDKVFFYFNSYKLFEKAKKIFDYTFEFKRQNIIKNTAKEIDACFFDKIKFKNGFDIYQFILNNFSKDNYIFVPVFRDQLLAHYVMNDESPLSEMDIKRIYKNIMPRKNLSLLFGKNTGVGDKIRIEC